MLSKRNGLWLSAFCLVLSYCAMKDQKRARQLKLYIEYMISGDEESETVTGFLQFRSDTIGRGLTLQQPAKVELDGETLQWDTTALNGAFYEFQKPLTTFAGQHTLVFTDENGIRYTEEFNYQPFALDIELGEQVKRRELVLPITGLQKKDSIKVVLSDTAFYTDGINAWDTLQNGLLDLRNKLATVSNGPVVLQLYKESEKLIKHGTTTVGKISISYHLKREFELVD